MTMLYLNLCYIKECYKGTALYNLFCISFQVFFRAGALNRLESSRDDRVTGRVTSFQAYCRGYLARKKLQKLKVRLWQISVYSQPSL